jgi:hypothetical protein
MPERVLQIFRDGRRFRPKTETKLLDGYQGNLQTLEIMAQMVRDDRTQIDLRRFVERHILGKIPGHRFEAEIEAMFNFCQKKILYRKDPAKVERVADLWSCLFALNRDSPEGDCSIKATALATMLAMFGNKPNFVIIKQNPHSTNFNHVFCEVEIAGEMKTLDPLSLLPCHQLFLPNLLTESI